MQSEHIVAIVAAFGGLSGLAAFVTAIMTARSTARKNDVETLAQTIETLQTENARLVKRLGEMEVENAALRTRQATAEGQIDTLQCEVQRLREENERLRSARAGRRPRGDGTANAGK